MLAEEKLPRKLVMVLSLDLDLEVLLLFFSTRRVKRLEISWRVLSLSALISSSCSLIHTIIHFCLWWSLLARMLSFQCPKKVVTEAPPIEIPPPTPTVGEQQRGPHVNCSCGAGEKVHTHDFSQRHLCLLLPQMNGNPFLQQLWSDVCVLISHRVKLVHLVLQVQRVKRSSLTAFKHCVWQKIAVS